MVRFLAVTLFFLSFSSVAIAQNSPCETQHCIAVVDAGSSGSRLHVYAYDIDETNSPVHVRELWYNNVNPGLSSIDTSPTAIDKYLSDLLASSPIKHIPIYFYATAGMRLQPQNKQKLYYEQLKHWFENHSEWVLQEAKTITGDEEGLYDWLSINYHLGTFTSPNQEAVGVMDMGGASVQIAFPVAENNSIDKKSQVKIDIYGRHYTLYVHSFLGLGQNELSRQFLNSSTCFSNNYPLPDGEMAQGNALTCELKVAGLMNQTHGVKQLIQPILAANPVSAWYGIGGISYLLDNSIFDFANTQFTGADLIHQADERICHQDWDGISKQFPNDNYAFEYCLFSASYYALMIDGYGIQPEEPIHYLPAKSNIGWTTGVILFHAS